MSKKTGKSKFPESSGAQFRPQSSANALESPKGPAKADATSRAPEAARPAKGVPNMSCPGVRASSFLRNSSFFRISSSMFCHAALLSLGVVLRASAAEPTPAQLQFFETRVRPVLANNCYKCHSQQAEKVKGGLMLDTRDSLLRGGENGPVLVAGNPDASLLVKAIRYQDPDLQMPPKKQLAENEIADLAAWIKMGAPDPRLASGTPTASSDADQQHWAWQPLRKPAIPEAGDRAWAKTPVDNFILAKLDEKGLKPNPPADKRTLLRRATFDLIGLPPTPDEVADFLKDESPDAFAKVVDRLLASAHYGERWGRHWLDVARYSDTKGQIRRQRETEQYPFAWTYRDYVIRSFNDDKPYNVFVIEQLAADKLPITARNPTNLAALGFLTVGERFMDMQNDIINDRIDVVTKGFLGLTVTCARCHDHKFDPIPTKDYYSLHGIFASCVEPEIEPVISKVPSTPEYHDYYTRRMGLQEAKLELEAELKQMWGKRDPMRVKQLQKQMRENMEGIAKLELTHPAAPARAMVLEDAPRPHDSPVFVRGEAGNRGPIVPRRFLEVLSGPYRRVFTNGSGRLDLACAIVGKNDPIAARVMVNRIWLHHFGEGFVSTPDDFGTRAEPPSHPELLDYLACRFVEGGWSIKQMHRLIMLSSVYQESSAGNPRYAQVDPGNRLLWRANIRRLEFEALRDSLLAIGGDLDPAMYGRPVDLEREPYSTRRTIYGVIDRSDVADVLVNFDVANPDLPSGRRHETTVPQQALFLMNSPLVIEQARHLVALPDFHDCADDGARVKFLYERVYQRPPDPQEIQLGVEFIAETPHPERPAPQNTSMAPLSDEQREMKKKQGRNGAGPRRRPPLKAWEEYAHALLQANETSFVN
jgi:hypothetical protein